MKKYIYTAIIILLLLCIGCMVSLLFGSIMISPSTLWGLITGELSDEKIKQLLLTIRLPRMFIAILVGANLAIAGSMMQCITQNPLASPQVFGINAGALFAMTIGMVLFPTLENQAVTLFAIFGATCSGLIVLGFSKGSNQTIYLALAGMALHLVLLSLTRVILIFHERSKETLIFWMAGSIDGSTWGDVQLIGGWSLLFIFFAFIMAKSLNLLSLGEDIAQGLGLNPRILKLFSSMIIIILSALSVAVAGTIGFIGLIVPHIVRKLVGNDYRAILPFSSLVGATLLVYADVCSRLISYPFETPVGIVTALIGVPAFFYLMKKEVKPS